MADSADSFPTSTEGLPEARQPELVELADGDRFELRITPIAKRLGDQTVRMLAYNGSIPGPTLRVAEGAEVEVLITNEGDLADTVHWHGLRLENRYDGTHETQRPLEPGDTFTARIKCPDPGAYWYHPHLRQDYGQEMGLYGSLIVEPADPDYWSPAHREIPLTLDDVLLEEGRVGPFSPTETTHVAMGRFGDVLLVGGETELALDARRGEVIRFFLTNTANTRVFRVATPGARMKLVGGDAGRVEQEEFVEDVTLGPSERVVVDVLFDEPGQVTLEHRTPGRTYELARVTVSEEEAEPDLRAAFGRLRENEEMKAERERTRPYLEAEPAKTIGFLAEMDMGDEEAEGPYTCPMHPEVVQEEPGHCPECGMKLMSSELVGQATEHSHDHADAGHEPDSPSDGIEWEDDMVEMNRMMTPANMRWKIVDLEVETDGQEIDWQFRVGDEVKVRVKNELVGDHPMHHPFHIHGAGRFLVLARDGEPEDNLVWKDTVLIPAGQTVDLFLQVTNPGRWMAHCHIAEHHEAGMMFSFDVLPAA
jgi:FtsP/CotA-like multicopper oxidase with cupredoxin domain